MSYNFYTSESRKPSAKTGINPIKKPFSFFRALESDGQNNNLGEAPGGSGILSGTRCLYSYLALPTRQSNRIAGDNARSGGNRINWREPIWRRPSTFPGKDPYRASRRWREIYRANFNRTSRAA